MTRRRVLLVGLDPGVVDYGRLPGLTHELLRAAIDAAKAAVNARGYDAELCLIDTGATAERTLAAALAGAAWDCVLIGAGVRASPDHFRLFERLINVVHHQAPHAHICFNTNPADSAEAVARWVSPDT